MERAAISAGQKVNSSTIILHHLWWLNHRHGGTPRFQYGKTLCCDATLVSTLTRAGFPAHGAHLHNGAALQAAQHRKQARYPELLRPGPQRLLVLAAELVAAGMLIATSSSDSSSQRGFHALLLPSAQRPQLAGAADGGPYSAPPSNAQSRRGSPPLPPPRWGRASAGQGPSQMPLRVAA